MKHANGKYKGKMVRCLIHFKINNKELKLNFSQIYKKNFHLMNFPGGKISFNILHFECDKTGQFNSTRGLTVFYYRNCELQKPLRLTYIFL